MFFVFPSLFWASFSVGSLFTPFRVASQYRQFEFPCYGLFLPFFPSRFFFSLLRVFPHQIGVFSQEGDWIGWLELRSTSVIFYFWAWDRRWWLLSICGLFLFATCSGLSSWPYLVWCSIRVPYMDFNVRAPWLFLFSHFNFFTILFW